MMIKELFNKMHVTLNISTTSIRLLSVKGRRARKWGSIRLESGLVKDGLILQPKAVGEAINALFESTKVPKKRVIISINGLTFTYRILSLPRMKPALLQEAIERAARKEMTLPLEELYLSWQVIGGRHDELDFFVLGVPRNLIDALAQTSAEAGVKDYIMDLTPLALARAANQGDALIVALEPDCFDIVLVANGVPTIMHTITPRGDGARIEDNIQRLADELSKTVTFYNSSHPETLLSPTTPLLLTGELSADATTSELIQAEMEYPVELLVPPLELPSGLPTASYAANMGLALKEMRQKTVSKRGATRFRDINLNILPDIYRTSIYMPRAQQSPLRYILFSLILIIAAGLLTPTYQVKSQADAETMRLQTQLSRLSQELQRADLVIEETKQIEDTINELTADVEALKQEHQYILGGGGDFANNMTLVTSTLPYEASFTSIAIDTDQITVEGEADSSLTVISYVMALEAQGRFSEVRIAQIEESRRAKIEITDEDAAVSYTVDINDLSGTFTVKTKTPFIISDLTIFPTEVDIGESVTISVLVTNTGDLTDSRRVTLKIDNEVVATKNVTLAGGFSRTVTFTTVAGTMEHEITVTPFVIVISK